MKCNKCGKDNRDIARYCKWCGATMGAIQTPPPLPGAAVGTDQNGALSSASSGALDILVDKDQIRASLSDIAAKGAAMKAYNDAHKLNFRMELSFVITGDSGTGKATVAKAIAALLHEKGLVNNPVPKIIDPTDYRKFVEKIDENLKYFGNGVLIIKEADKLVPDGVQKDVAPIDHIIKHIRKWRGDAAKPVVILLGGKRLKKFFDENPVPASAVNYFLETPGISDDGLLNITERLLLETCGRALTEEGRQKLKRIYLYDRRNPDAAQGAGGHNAERRAYDINLKCIGVLPDGAPVGPDMIDGTEYIPKTYDEVMQSFDKYVGVDEIKEEIRKITLKLEEQRKRLGPGATVELYDQFQFLGNPGTGKTTMARLFADALNSLGALPVGHLVEVGRDDLVSQYVGETPKLVRSVFDKAMGGVLFIDEAYSLKQNDSDAVGQQAIDTILTLAENRRGKVIVILAGYSKEMGEFIHSNSGLESRFNKIINFRDYTGKELAEIFRRMVKSSPEGYTLSAKAEEHLDQVFERMEKMKTRNFGNAREVRNKYQQAVSALIARNDKARQDGTFDESKKNEIDLVDIEGNRTVLSADELLKGFDDFIGMQGVKEQIRSFANRIKLARIKAMRGGKVEQPNIHIIITGNPGTGKTEVAKRMGQVFKALGILPKGHVVCKERKHILDSYVNSAGKNMEKAVDEAMGGVLFIDEAYTFMPADPSGVKDKSGNEAIEALMTRMSNDAGKFVTVFAGYKQEMDEFINNANPGLKRRFTYSIHIDDYTVDELVQIFMLNARKEGYRLTPEAEELLNLKVEEMVSAKDEKFGNAGEMVKLFNTTKDRQSDRISDNITEELSDEELYTIEKCDIPYDAPKKIDVEECMKELDELEGLKAVKDAVREIADTLIVEQKRNADNGGRHKLNLDHLLFLGNPGTGKTTVARVMGNIYYSLGLLPSNKVIEVTPKDLIAPYVGQTAPKTEQMINRAIGGILFLDEAYGLNDGPNGFGKDAMPVLLTKLLDLKGKFVCIAAGYHREMQQWIDTNTGMDSRFQRRINFEDYSAEELGNIFRGVVRKAGLKMDDGAEAEMERYFNVLVYNKGRNFANAREARNYFDRVKLNQGRRLRELLRNPDFDNSELYVLRREDMIVKE